MIDKTVYRQACESQINAFGFVFSAHGCPCNGSPLIYRTTKEGHRMEFDVWPSRGYWRLYEDRTMVACGTQPEDIIKKINTVWQILEP